MRKRNNKRKASIKTRILKSTLLLIIIIFSSITLIFNLILKRYIERMTHSSLENIKKVISEVNEDIKFVDLSQLDNEQKIFLFLKNIQHREKGNGHGNSNNAQIFIIDQDYNLIYPNVNEQGIQNNLGYSNIIETIESKNIDLSVEDNITLKVENNNFYISFMEISSLSENKSYYAGVFLDLTSVKHLERQVNLLLVIVICIAAVLSIIISIVLSNRIVKPIKKISEFAEQIGRGDFSRCKYNFQDRELDDLSMVMNKSAEYLDKYDKEQKIFFQNVSHELRTPLMSIKGYAEAIKYNVYDKDMASEIILEESDRLSSLIEELLYLSRTDNITKDYIFVEKDLREILSNCVQRQKIGALNKNIQFIFDFDDKPVLLYCEEKSLFRAFFNIIDNALRYARNKIIITCKNEQKNIIVNIINDGESIKNEEMPYIFDRFYKGKNGKHGIGLSIVKTIIDKHKGTVKAENSSMGVVFKIEFKNDK